ncbi:hypothetical protein [Halobacillus litoralis]|uniref:hypothetical protein n=1 Tax=Halobacillus litoralis TaxID=45668 RepID=UPI001CFD299C|nr:hypothetical protein [Halobacillus litoralis]
MTQKKEKKKEKTLFEVLQEIDVETSKMNGIIKQPEKKFKEWEKDFGAWERRFTKQMTDMEKFLNKQAGKLEKFFE